MKREFLRGLDKYKKLNDKYIIKYCQETISVNIRDIVYVESQKRKLFIKLSNDHTFEKYGKLTEQEQLIKTHSFLQPHRSFIINPKYILKLNNQNLLLTTQESINISRKYQKTFKQAYYEYLLTNFS